MYFTNSHLTDHKSLIHLVLILGSAKVATRVYTEPQDTRLRQVAEYLKTKN